MHLSPLTLSERATGTQGRIDSWIPSRKHPFHLFQRNIQTIVQPDNTILAIVEAVDMPGQQPSEGQGRAMSSFDLAGICFHGVGPKDMTDGVTPLRRIPNFSVDVAYTRPVTRPVQATNLFYSELFRMLRPRGLYTFLTPDRRQGAMSRARHGGSSLLGSAFGARRSIKRQAARHGFHVERLERLPDAGPANYRPPGVPPITSDGIDGWIMGVLRKKDLRELL